MSFNTDELKAVYDKIVSISIEEGRIMEQIKFLKIVNNLHRQGRISDDIAQVFHLEITTDLD